MARALDERPASRRPFFWRTHGAFLLLLAVVAPLTVAFSWQDVVASVSDDSVSYLTLARHFAHLGGDPLLSPWAKYFGHFPPLFPALLAATGGGHSLLAAHLLVGACSLVALCLVYRHAALRLGSAGAGCAVAFLFALAPTAWICARGILSEPLYLAVSLGALLFHERRLAAEGDRRAALGFGMLLAAAYLTRVAAITLVAAYALHVAITALQRRRLPPVSSSLPFVPLAILVGAWLALRPQAGTDSYRWILEFLAADWWSRPGVLAATSWDSLVGAWISSFTVGSDVGSAMRAFFVAVGIASLAGALRAARHNRLDGWYVLVSLAMLFAWVFPEENTRRLLYPLLPLMLVHAAEALRVAGRFLGPDVARPALLAGAALTGAMTVPASLLVLERASDTETLIPGFAYTPAAMTEYYTTINVSWAHALARRHAAVLAGLESVARTTPPGAKVMWVRPEYVALLGRRPAVPWYYRWDRDALAREIAASGTDYVVVARLFKSDLDHAGGDAFASVTFGAASYLRPKAAIFNPDVRVEDFVLEEVDRPALAARLAQSR